MLDTIKMQECEHCEKSKASKNAANRSDDLSAGHF